MKKPLSIFLAGILAVTLLDSLGAMASRQLSFNYSLLSVVSFIVYIGFAFLLTKQADKKTTIILTGLLGLFDSTIGWNLSELLGANTGENNIEITTKETTTCAEPYEEYLAQTNVVPKDRAAISQFIYGNMVLPEAESNHKTGFYPHLIDDEITLTHHIALIGGNNPAEKPAPIEKE